ncbi:MAG TPA: GyrI-like domain-containing protein [Rhizomicrobium sp.]|nr:GyrI-like domain-containing protein [Rhizomicrobium sp.]
MDQSSSLGPPRVESHGRFLLAGYRRRYPLGRDLSWIMESVHCQWLSFLPRKREPVLALGTDTYGVCLRITEGDVAFDYFCGVRVAEARDLPEGFVTLEVPPHHYAVFRHDGAKSELLTSYLRIFGELMPEAGLTHAGEGAPEFVEHFDSAYDLATLSGGPEIMVPVKA